MFGGVGSEVGVFGAFGGGVAFVFAAEAELVFDGLVLQQFLEVVLIIIVPFLHMLLELASECIFHLLSTAPPHFSAPLGAVGPTRPIKVAGVHKVQPTPPTRLPLIYPRQHP